MAVEIRLPNITGATEKEQLLQLKSYLYQLSEQLQWAFDNISTTGGSGNGYVVNEAPRAFTASSGTSGINAEATFAALKSLIIKSADIVNAYYDEINTRLEGLYVAQSDFGAFAEKTTQDIEANSTGITQTFENVQVIIKNTEDEIDGKLTTIGQDLSYAQNDVIVLKGNVEDINFNISSVEADIGELDTELREEISSTASDLNNNIAGAKDELNGNINTAKSELNSNIDNAAANANAYTDAAEAAAKGYTDYAASELDGKIGKTASELDGKITDANGRIDETNGKVSDLGDGLDAANGRIGGVEQELQASKSNITDEIQKVSDSVSKLDELRKAAEDELRGGLEDVGDILTTMTGILLEKDGIVTIGTTGTIKSGHLYTMSDGVAVYGLEVGQNIKINGTDVYSKIARLTSQGLYFFNPKSYDPSLSDEKNAVAYISDKKLYIGQAEILTSLKIGKLVDYVLDNGDVATKWEGGS